ncbi:MULTISPECIES: hypothetical protein [unclassified Butyrivibrio]|uniref:hypothetical protein n=1 Tax=unclassified Butyrivibrio TaxID=2639466 RepID=UPI0004122569|nr:MULTISPECIES: hypothetical protein [unclassified Butyrivibrio]
MNFNPKAIMELQQRFNTFRLDHPRVFPFFQAVKESSMEVGTIIDMKVTTPDGVEKQCNIRITQNDIETFKTLMSMNGVSQ